MSGRHQPLNGADSPQALVGYVPARSVRHDSVEPDCYGCIRSQPCSMACAACRCRWSGDPMTPRENCADERCACHHDGAAECTNCQAITSDIRRLDFGRAGIWEVCGVCLDKMDERAEQYEEATA